MSQALRLILDHFGIDFNEDNFLTRCGKCNASELHSIEKEKVANDPRVPAKVCQTPQL